MVSRGYLRTYGTLRPHGCVSERPDRCDSDVENGCRGGRCRGRCADRHISWPWQRMTSIPAFSCDLTHQYFLDFFGLTSSLKKNRRTFSRGWLLGDSTAPPDGVNGMGCRGPSSRPWTSSTPWRRSVRFTGRPRLPHSPQGVLFRTSGVFRSGIGCRLRPSKRILIWGLISIFDLIQGF